MAMFYVANCYNLPGRVAKFTKLLDGSFIPSPGHTKITIVEIPNHAFL